jgi:glycosyltransferase involved in cell wall biosynthesis
VEIPSRPRKYLIVDFGASLIHTHHAQSIYSFFDLLKTQAIHPEIWVPLGSNLRSKFYPNENKLLPGTHPCAFQLTYVKTWIPGLLGKLHNLALKYNLVFLQKFLVNFISLHFCFKILRLNKSFELSIIFPTMCPFAIKSIYELEKRKVSCNVYCRTTNAIEIRGPLSEMYSIYPLILRSKNFVYLKVRYGAETNHNYQIIRSLNLNSFISKIPATTPRIKKQNQNSSITVSFLGYPTRDKGQNHILPIIQAVTKRRLDIIWQVHVYENDPIENKLKNSVHDINLIRGKVENKVIDEALSNTDVLCLPYDIKAFKIKASAMHYKASDYLKPVITFAGTEFAEEINDFKSGFVALNIDQFCNALINLNLSQISDWKNGCHNYNLSRNKSNLYFLNLGHEN